MRQFRRVMLVLLLILMIGQFAHAVSGIPSPARFKGQAKEAYAAARSHTALASSLFCYCGCDHQKGHKQLIDCYKNEHAARCSTCQETLIRAVGYQKTGMATKDIVKKIDLEFQSRYPFCDASVALKKHQAKCKCKH